jgi:hypothetical protein
VKCGGIGVVVIDDRTQQNIPLAQLKIPYINANLSNVKFIFFCFCFA